MNSASLSSSGVFFFGRLSEPGHYLYAPGGQRVSHSGTLNLPFNVNILDAGLLPQVGPETQGEEHLAIINGWTIVSMWDRSGDSRPRSNAAFIVRGINTREEVMAMARLVFPLIVKRIKGEKTDAS